LKCSSFCCGKSFFFFNFQFQVCAYFSTLTSFPFYCLCQNEILKAFPTINISIEVQLNPIEFVKSSRKQNDKVIKVSIAISAASSSCMLPVACSLWVNVLHCSLGSAEIFIIALSHSARGESKEKKINLCLRQLAMLLCNSLRGFNTYILILDIPKGIQMQPFIKQWINNMCSSSNMYHFPWVA